MQHLWRRTLVPAGIALVLCGGSITNSAPALAAPGAAEQTPPVAEEPPPRTEPIPGEGTEPPPPGEPVAAAPAVGAPSNRVTVSGVLDFYYLYQFSNPKNGQRLNGRIYDFRHSTPTLALAWADIEKKAAPGGFGFLVSLATGDSVDADHADPDSGAGEARYKNFQQIFATYAARNGLTVDVGKYLSPYGYDTTKVILNPNYSVTLATFLAPNYVGGLRVGYPVTRDLSLQGYVVNSIYHTRTSGISEDNNRKSYILRANYTTPGGRLNYITAYGWGRDKLGDIPGNEDVMLWDNWLTFKLTPTVTLAGEYLYHEADDRGGGYDRKAHGYGVYYRNQLTPRNAIALRYSRLTNNTRPTATVAALSRQEALSPTIYGVWEVTGTYEIKVTPQFTTRFEYRHDKSNNAAAFGFVDGDSGTPDDTQDTLTIAGLYTF